MQRETKSALQNFRVRRQSSIEKVYRKEFKHLGIRGEVLQEKGRLMQTVDGLEVMSDKGSQGEESSGKSYS